MMVSVKKKKTEPCESVEQKQKISIHEEATKHSILGLICSCFDERNKVSNVFIKEKIKAESFTFVLLQSSMP